MAVGPPPQLPTVSASGPDNNMTESVQEQSVAVNIAPRSSSENQAQAAQTSSASVSTSAAISALDNALNYARAASQGFAPISRAQSSTVASSGPQPESQSVGTGTGPSGGPTLSPMISFSLSPAAEQRPQSRIGGDRSGSGLVVPTGRLARRSRGGGIRVVRGAGARRRSGSSSSGVKRQRLSDPASASSKSVKWASLRQLLSENANSQKTDRGGPRPPTSDVSAGPCGVERLVVYVYDPKRVQVLSDLVDGQSELCDKAAQLSESTNSYFSPGVCFLALRACSNDLNSAAKWLTSHGEEARARKCARMEKRMVLGSSVENGAKV
eukprot:716471_1